MNDIERFADWLTQEDGEPEGGLNRPPEVPVFLPRYPFVSSYSSSRGTDSMATTKVYIALVILLVGSVLIGVVLVSALLKDCVFGRRFP